MHLHLSLDYVYVSQHISNFDIFTKKNWILCELNLKWPPRSQLFVHSDNKVVAIRNSSLMEIFCRLQDIFLLLQGRVSSQKIDYFVLDSIAELSLIIKIGPRYENCINPFPIFIPRSWKCSYLWRKTRKKHHYMDLWQFFPRNVAMAFAWPLRYAYCASSPPPYFWSTEDLSTPSSGWHGKGF